MILLIAALIFFTVKGQEFYKKETFEKTILPASVAINFTAKDQGHTIEYIGRRGYSVLNLLRQTADVKTFATNHAWIKSINGVAVGPNSFWAFTIDGKPSDLPPGEQEVKENQKIVWTWQGDKSK